MPQSQRRTINALISLLEDDDQQVSTLAMEQLLAMDDDAYGLVAELQEANSPVLRGRIHQLGNILNIRRARSRFIRQVHEASMTLWDGLLQLNYQYNPRMNFDAVERMLDDLIERLPLRLSTVRMARFMRDEGFTLTGHDTLGADLFLPEDVLAQRIGAPVLLSVIARHLGEQRNWHSSIVLYHGKHCLVDSHYNLVVPSDDWQVERLTTEDKLHPCGDRDVWLTVLSQLFLSAVMDGSLQAIHRMGIILARLGGCASLDPMPFPLGDG